MGGRECCKYFEDFAMGGVGTEASFAQWRTMCQSKCLVHLCKFGKKERNVCILPLGVLYSCMKADTCLTTLPLPNNKHSHTHIYTYTVYTGMYTACIHLHTHTHMHAQTVRHTTSEPSASFYFGCDGTAQFTRENGMDAQNLPNTDTEPKQLAIVYILQTLSQTSFFWM